MTDRQHWSLLDYCYAINDATDTGHPGLAMALLREMNSRQWERN